MLRPLLLSLLAGCETEDAPEPPTEPPDPLRAHIAHLASDDLNGRETGTDDIARAAEYIAETLRGCGLSPVPGADDLFAPYTLYRSGYDLEQTALSVTVGGETIKLEGHSGEAYTVEGGKILVNGKVVA